MRHIAILCLLVLLSVITTDAYADTLRQESFEGCTGSGYSLMTGSFFGNVDDGVLCGNDDGGARDFSFSFSGDVTGQQGTDYIGLEDVAGAGMTNPNAVVLSAIDISGYSDFGISFLFAAPNATLGRYDVTPTPDTLQLQYSVDGGSFVTVGSFRGAGTGVAGMMEDHDLDGSFTQGVSGLAMQRFSYTLNNRAGQGTVTGSSLVVRVLFSSDGAQEEMVFDDIIVTGTVAAPTINLSANTYQINENGTAVGGQATLVRTGATGATSINLTFTSGTATGGGVDFTSTTMSVSFGVGVNSVPVSLPIISDSIDESNESFTIGLSADGSGALPGSTNSATVTIVDDDTANVLVSEITVSTVEGGISDTYTVVLASQPTANVLIDIAATSDEVEFSTGGSPAADSLTLTFTSGNWSTPQTVTVSAVNDTDVEADPHSDTITHTATSGDASYNGFSVDSIAASVADDDVCGDAFCNPTESTVTCPADCGSSCGDTACNGAESTANCAADCGTLCGDTVCNGSESTANCVADCGSSCGDTACNGAESTANCALDCGSSCGDGAVNGNEVCDGNVLSGESCSTQGYDFGTLACANDCLSLDDSACANNVCGDGVEFGAEECDDGSNNSDSVVDACRTDCTEAGCGDGVVDTGEACDGLNLAGESCASLSFSSGTLGCDIDCSAYDVSACQMDVPVEAGVDGGTDGGSVGTGDGDASTGYAATSTDIGFSTGGAVTSDDTGGVPTSDVETTLEWQTIDSGLGGGGFTSEEGSTIGLSTSTEATVGGTTVGGGMTSGDEGTIDVMTSEAVGTSGVTTSDEATSTDVSMGGGMTSDVTTVAVYTSDDVTLGGVTSEIAVTTVGGATTDGISWGGGVGTVEDAGADAGYSTSGGTAGGGGNTTADEDTTVGGGNETSQPEGETTDDGPVVVPPLDLDAGFDAGPDAGFVDGPIGDGCDCRIGAQPRHGNARLFGLALVGLALARMRRRRK